jgi:hypothetical protein
MINNKTGVRGRQGSAGTELTKGQAFAGRSTCNGWKLQIGNCKLQIEICSCRFAIFNPVGFAGKTTLRSPPQAFPRPGGAWAGV